MKSISDPNQQNIIIENYINTLTGQVRILEAGCGGKWPLSLKSNYHLTGVDLNEDLLKKRERTLKDLHEARLANIRDDIFKPKSFDVIYSAYVLEHIPEPRWVMDNFVRWLRPDGLLIIKMTDRKSVSRHDIWDFCDDNGFTIAEELCLSDDAYNRPFTMILNKIASYLTFGGFRGNTNLTYVLQKRAEMHRNTASCHRHIEPTTYMQQST